MKKYLIVGVVAFSLMITTVYALNDNSNNIINEPTYNQNCPYHNGSEDCPCYDETTNTHNCPNNDRNHQHYSRNGYSRHGGCFHHNR